MMQRKSCSTSSSQELNGKMSTRRRSVSKTFMVLYFSPFFLFSATDVIERSPSPGKRHFPEGAIKVTSCEEPPSRNHAACQQEDNCY